MNRIARLLALAVVLSIPYPIAQAEENFQSPDIFVLGDSQLSFGAGVAFVEFFRNISGQCGLKKGLSVGVLGVRSSSLTAWTATETAGKNSICGIDPKWNVNAGSFGVINRTKNKYVQIGQGEAYQFCRAGQSPFQAMFASGYYNPKLFVMFFLGNATERWAKSAADALVDVKKTIRDLPPGMPCIFMTTAPAYTEKVVRERQQAQVNIENAFLTVGKQCTFVRGYTPTTVSANLGNAANFRRKPDGSVKDPYHPTEDSARQFLSLVKDDLCAARLGNDTARILCDLLGYGAQDIVVGFS
jgi:hypothetical protein